MSPASLFQTPLNFFEVITPLFSLGAIFSGVVVFLFIYTRWHQRLYLAMILLALFAFGFVGSGIITDIFGGMQHNISISRQFHRTEQLCGAYFLFGLPLFLTYLLDLTPSWKRLNARIALGGLIISCGITVIAILAPDLFISQTSPQDDWLLRESAYGRGKQGIFYSIRDILLAVEIIYAFTVIILEMIRKRSAKYLGLILAGLFIAIYAAADDTIHIYTRIHITPMPELDYSRFTIGLTVFILLTMASTARRFADEAKDVENAYAAFNSSEEKFLQIASSINEVFWLVDLNARKLLYVNQAYERIWGKRHEALYTSLDTWIETIHSDDRPRVEAAVFNSRHTDPMEIEYRMQRSDGETRWIRERIAPVFSDGRETNRLVRISEDITDAKQANDNLTYLAYHDALTGLFNRKSLYQKIDDIIVQEKRAHRVSSWGLLILDLDSFKNINDMLGHTIADAVLIRTAQTIQRCVRSSDYVFRVGGDEFAVLLTNMMSETHAGIVTQKIIDELAVPFVMNGSTIHTGTSVGIAIYPRDGEDAESLFRNADEALFEAKKERNRFLFFTADMQTKAFDKLKLIEQMRVAIDRKEFQVYYQPQIDQNGRIVGAEALIRWKHPERGFIPPDEFIPVAEETGLIIPIGKWVLETACGDLKRLANAGFERLSIAVNLSVRQFRDKALVDTIDKALAASGIDVHQLHLEITESALVDDVDGAIAILNTIRSKGISFSIDDFGTGYSSLSYLKRFPITTLKIDRSFIEGIPIDRENTALVKAIISMAHEFGLTVIAEGVETKEQCTFLHSNSCGIIQGYLYSPALPHDKFLAFAQAHC
ncbi:MAG: EAL domain-containing protein [Spirochaetes bacterium]|nr:EAL domain-containing protein [Spirochaetota bacterium]